MCPYIRQYHGNFPLNTLLDGDTMIKLHSILLIIFMTIPMNVIAEQKIYGIYSNMNALRGEPSGFEMFFLHDGRSGQCNDSVIFQVAEGWPQYPELLDCCVCSVNHIEFVSKKWGKFVGKIENETLVGEFIKAKHKITLKKGKSFWQKD